MTDTSAPGHVISPDVIRFERNLPGPINRVWAYVTDGEMRGKWFASGDWDLRVGGRTELNFDHAQLSPIKEPPPPGFDGKGHQSVGEILAIDPPRLVTITFDGGSEVTFELAERGDEVLLSITHRKIANRAAMLSYSGGWHTHLAILEAHAAGRTPPPFWSTWTGLKDQYETLIP